MRQRRGRMETPRRRCDTVSETLVVLKRGESETPRKWRCVAAEMATGGLENTGDAENDSNDTEKRGCWRSNYSDAEGGPLAGGALLVALPSRCGK